ncbi:aldehyde dehydrogenase family protein, partial [Acidimicrobiaceae bacterium USS-CC1]|nr:aldehyde dehydrogenase family protein [Acidiferrimicrobium australe]
LAESADEVDELVVYFRSAGEDATRLAGAAPPSVSPDRRALLRRVPLGVVGVVVPWNWPYTMAAELVAPALAAGNTVVWVPAPSTSACSLLLAEVVSEADWPPGVLNVVAGDGPEVGDAVVGHPL